MSRRQATGMRGRGWSTAALQTAAIVAGVVASCVSTLARDQDSPFVGVFVGVALLLLAASVILWAGTTVKAVLVNIAAFALAVGIAEAHLGGNLSLGGPTRTYEGEFFRRIGGGYFVPDEIRGYAAAPDVRAIARVRAGDRLLLDVVYTTNALGLRIAPHDRDPSPPARAAGHDKVVFFGCSVTIGEGVRDEETMPWVFETRSRGRYWAYNFGFHGYGPHQMLRILETGLVDAVMPGMPPTRAVYQGLMEHIERVAGNYPAVSWGPSTPRYVLGDGGTPEYRGPFYGSRGTAVFSVANRSHVFRLIGPVALGRRRTPADIDLYVSVVERSRKLFETRYAGRFSVVMWGAYDQDYPGVVARLRHAGIEVFEVHQIIPDIYTADRQWKLVGDEHPNAATHALIAEFLLGAL